MSQPCRNRTGSLSDLFWALSDRTTLRFKIMGIVLGFVIILGIGVTLQVRRSMSTTLGRELDKEGITIARDLAARSADLLLVNNTFTLFEIVMETLANNEDLRYIFIQDPRGNVTVHTFEGGFPTQLINANIVSGDDRFRIELLRTEEGFIRDVAVPIFEGRSGIARVGLTEARVNRSISAITGQLLGATAAVSLVGIAAAYVLTGVLTRPIVEVVKVTKAVARGDLSKRVSTWATNDEIGQLGSSLNTMITNLNQSQTKLAEFGQAMVRRNEELTALYSIASTLNESLDLQDVLEASLQEVLNLTGLSFGQVYILDRDKGKLVLRAARGGAPESADLPWEMELGEGLPGRVAQSARAFMAADVSSVAILSRVASDETQFAVDGTIPAIGIPLMAKTRLVGVMVFHSLDQIKPNPGTLDLLSSIGHQIGVALENASLWEELKRKEEIRAHLLEKVITAQEEERKRIARELHDETSQALTSLMVGLKVIEGSGSLQEVRERTADLRALAAATLKDIHDLALELRPSVLDDLGLVAALHRYVKEACPKMGLQVDLHISGMEGRRLRSEIETTVYRIIQEALTNVAKHARANNVSVVLEHRNSHLVAIIEDDGLGFDPEEVLGTSAENRRLGLFGMQERASLIGGDLTVESTPGVGTSIYLKVPLGEVGVA